MRTYHHTTSAEARAVVREEVARVVVATAVARAEERSAAHSRCNQFQKCTALACHTRL